jgi:centrin-3
VTEKFSKRDPEDEMRKAFILFDEENTGKITFKQLKKIAKEIGENNINDEELEAMITEFDTDGDGASFFFYFILFCFYLFACF